MRKLRKAVALAAVLLFALGAIVPTALASGTSLVTLRAEVVNNKYSWALGSSDPLPVVRVVPSPATASLTYQWYQGETGKGTLLEGQTSASMQLTRAMLGNTVGTVVRFYCVARSTTGAMIFDPGNPPWVNIQVTGPALDAPATTTPVDPSTQTAPIELKWKSELPANLIDSSCSATWTCVEASAPGTIDAAPSITTSSAQITRTSVSGVITGTPDLRTSATYTYDLTVRLADNIVVEKKGVTVQVNSVSNEHPELTKPATWRASGGIAIETSDGGKTYYAACRQNAFRNDEGKVSYELLKVSEKAITLSATSQYFTVYTGSENGNQTTSNPSDSNGIIQVSPYTPIGVYTLTVQDATRTQAQVTIVVQGALDATETQNLEPNDTASLKATLTNGTNTTLPAAGFSNIVWNWTSTDGLTVTKDSSSGITSNASLTVAPTAPDGTGTISVTPTIGGIPLAQTGAISIVVKNLQASKLDGIAIYEMPNTTTPIPASQALACNGRQYQLTANWTTEPTESWTYVWTVTRPAGATTNGTAPTLTTPTTTPSIWFIPNANNVGTWTIGVRATSRSGEVADASTSIRIDRAAQEPGITSYLPLDTALMACPGEALNFAITPSAGLDTQGNRVTGDVYWVERTRDKETFQFTPSSTYTCTMPEEGSLTVTGYVASSGWQPTESPDLTGKPVVIWAVSPASPVPSITGALSIDPYAGTIVTDTETKTPAARVHIGGYATFGVTLSSANDPDDFVFTWETRPNATSAWQSAESFAGMEGQSYTTPLMTLGMDGSQYRVRVANRNDRTLEDVSSTVSLVVDSSQLTPKVTIESSSPPINAYQNPQTITVGAGTDVTMHAVVDLPYGVEHKLQWWRANSLEAGQTEYVWQEINGATTDSYTLRSARAMDNGDLYRCVATVDYSSGLTGTSDPVRINVEEEDGWVTVDSVLVDGDPIDLVAYAPDDPPELSVKAQALDGGSLGYQWYMNRSSSGNVRIEGATSATYTPDSLDAGATYAIWCEVRNVNDSSVPAVASNNVSIVYPRAATRPVISRQPVSRYDATPGETVNITVEAGAESQDALSYVWQSAPWQSDAWASIAQATGATLRLSNVPLSYNGRQYRCVVTNTVTSESVTSNICTLFVFDSNAYLRVAAPPAETVVTLPMLSSTSISAAVQVSASQDLSKYKYEWQYSPTMDGRYESTTASGELASLAATSTAQGDYVINVPLALLQDGNAISSGYYRLSVTNVGSSDQGIYATSTSDPGYVLVAPARTPYITRQPQDQTVPQGTSGTFSVTAAVSGGRTLYRWQKWAYTSATGNVDSEPPTPGLMGYWANCDSNDGTGINASTFSTVHATVEMRLAAYYQEPLYYRCLVYDAQSGNVTASDPALLTVTQQERIVPTLEPVEDSSLSFTGSGSDRQLDGLRATSTGTSVADVLKQMSPVRRGTIVITDKNGKVRTPGEIVATGDFIEVRLDDGTVADRAVIIVRGDVLGTGRMSLTQLVTMVEAMTGKSELTGPYLLAGDLTGDGKITLTDLVQEAQLFRNAMNPVNPDDPTPPDPTPTPGSSASPTASASSTASPTASQPTGSPIPTTTPTGNPTASPSSSATATATADPDAPTTPDPDPTATATNGDSGEDTGR